MFSKRALTCAGVGMAEGDYAGVMCGRAADVEICLDYCDRGRRMNGFHNT